MKSATSGISIIHQLEGDDPEAQDRRNPYPDEDSLVVMAQEPEGDREDERRERREDDPGGRPQPQLLP